MKVSRLKRRCQNQKGDYNTNQTLICLSSNKCVYHVYTTQLLVQGIDRLSVFLKQDITSTTENLQVCYVMRGEASVAFQTVSCLL